MNYLIAIILLSTYTAAFQSCTKTMPLERKKVDYVVCRVDSVDSVKYSFKPIPKQ